MVEPEIRLARPAESDQLRQLETEARSHLIDQRGGLRWLEEHPPARWENLSHDSSVIVATLDAVVLGYLVLGHPRAEIAVIEQVYVHPDARGIGCGDLMLEAAVTRARELGATYLEGQALPGDRDTKNLYERAGITARMITVSTRLN